MAINVFEISALHNNMLHTGTTSNDVADAKASEFPLVADNLNGQLARYVCLAGVFASASIGDTPGTTSNASWGQANGNGLGNTEASRPFGGYFVRGMWFTNEVDGTNNYRSGYIGSFVGGMQDDQYGHDPNGSSVDYEPIYGNLAPSWPMSATFSTQFRDQSQVPVTTGIITKHSSSAYSKTRYMPPSTFLIHLQNLDSTSTENLSSGKIRAFIEERPSLQIAGSGGHGPWDSSGTNKWPSTNQSMGNSGAIIAVGTPTSFTGGQSTNRSHELYPYEYFAAGGARKLNTRAMTLLLAKIFDNTSQSYGYPYEEDGSLASTSAVNVQTEYVWQRGGGQAGAPNAAQDQRVRNAAYFTINSTSRARKRRSAWPRACTACTCCS